MISEESLKIGAGCLVIKLFTYRKRKKTHTHTYIKVKPKHSSLCFESKKYIYISIFKILILLSKIVLSIIIQLKTFFRIKKS